MLDYCQAFVQHSFHTGLRLSQPPSTTRSVVRFLFASCSDSTRLSGSAKALVSLSSSGSDDNITAIVVDLKGYLSE